MSRHWSDTHNTLARCRRVVLPAGAGGGGSSRRLLRRRRARSLRARRARSLSTTQQNCRVCVTARTSRVLSKARARETSGSLLRARSDFCGETATQGSRTRSCSRRRPEADWRCPSSTPACASPRSAGSRARRVDALGKKVAAKTRARESAECERVRREMCSRESRSREILYCQAPPSGAGGAMRGPLTGRVAMQLLTMTDWGELRRVKFQRERERERERVRADDDDDGDDDTVRAPQASSTT